MLLMMLLVIRRGWGWWWISLLAWLLAITYNNNMTNSATRETHRMDSRKDVADDATEADNVYFQRLQHTSSHSYGAAVVGTCEMREFRGDKQPTAGEGEEVGCKGNTRSVCLYVEFLVRTKDKKTNENKPNDDDGHRSTRQAGRRPMCRFYVMRWWKERGRVDGLVGGKQEEARAASQQDNDRRRSFVQ